MATQQDFGGFGKLGSTLIGGNQPSETLAETQGMSLGANTQNAIAEAQLRQQKFKAASDLQNMSDDEAKSVGFAGGAAQARMYANFTLNSEHPKDIEDAAAKHQETAQRALAADPTQSDSVRAGAMYGAAGSAAADQTKSLGEGLIGNVLHPDINGTGAMNTPVSKAIVNEKQGAANLHNAEALHPEKYHFAPMGSGPIDPAAAENFADQVYNGTMQMSNFTGRLAGYAPAVAGVMAQKYPDFNLSDTQAVKSAGEKSWVGNGMNAQKVNSINQLAPHMELARETMKAMENGDNQTVNALKARWTAWTGGAAPTNVSQVAQIFGPELQRFIAPGVSTGEERAGAQTSMNLINSPGQSGEGFDQIKKMIAGRMNGLRQGRINDHGSDDLDARLVPGARTLYGKGTPGQDAVAPAKSTKTTGEVNFSDLAKSTP